jgi:hypothetical protein
MALTTNRDLQFYAVQELIDLPVDDNVNIYKGGFVGRNRTTGFARPLTAGDEFLGVAYKQADNTIAGHSAGGVNVRLHQMIDIVHSLSGVANADIGKDVYASDDGTLTLMVPLSFLSSTLVALSAQQIDSSSNPLASQGPFRVTWVANPRITWTDKFAVFRTDGQARPFIFQEELPVQVQVLAEGSELETNENQHQYGVKAIHQAGYGFWQDSCLVTFV